MYVVAANKIYPGSYSTIARLGIWDHNIGNFQEAPAVSLEKQSPSLDEGFVVFEVGRRLLWLRVEAKGGL